jgi:hypothetical protein
MGPQNDGSKVLSESLRNTRRLAAAYEVDYFEAVV